MAARRGRPDARRRPRGRRPVSGRPMGCGAERVRRGARRPGQAHRPPSRLVSRCAPGGLDPGSLARALPGGEALRPEPRGAVLKLGGAGDPPCHRAVPPPDGFRPPRTGSDPAHERRHPSAAHRVDERRRPVPASGRAVAGRAARGLGLPRRAARRHRDPRGRTWPPRPGWSANGCATRCAASPPGGRGDRHVALGSGRISPPVRPSGDPPRRVDVGRGAHRHSTRAAHAWRSPRSAVPRERGR
jgi:hypothetical protein